MTAHPSPHPPDTPSAHADLNLEQRQAVENIDGPLLVLAGAGTGKTRVLTSRLIHIIRSGGVSPDSILAVTFTNKAAAEMKKRIESGLMQSVQTLWIGTFHSLCARMLRRHGDITGLGSDFTILDSDDQQRLIRDIITERNIDRQIWPPALFASLIDRWKNDGMDPDQAAQSSSAKSHHGKMGLPIYRRYQEQLIRLKSVDFGDLILSCLNLLRRHPLILESYQQRFRYILVDEYQDTNTAQYLWLRLLAASHSNICCVGDDDQSIYAWRGAKVGNILRFEQDFAGAKIVRLERNYRSSGHILAAAEALIAHNQQRLGKKLWTDYGDGEKPRLCYCTSGTEESILAGQTILKLHQSGIPLENIAILVRTTAQTRSFEKHFFQASIPYRVIGGLRFYERMEIRDAIAWIRASARVEDDLAFRRILDRPKRGVGATTLEKIRQCALQHSLPLSLCAGKIAEGSLSIDRLSAKARQSLDELCQSLQRWRSKKDIMALKEWVKSILEESGYISMWRRSSAPDAPGKVENLNELIVSMEDFPDVAEFLEHISLVMESSRENTRGGVSLMTMHNAKGLEFDAVFLPGWEDGLFPHQRAIEEKEDGLEEERRLAYVAMTRARRHLFLSCAESRYLYQREIDCIPSRFIAELPKEHIITQSTNVHASMSSHGLSNDKGKRANYYRRSYQDQKSGARSGARSDAARSGTRSDAPRSEDIPKSGDRVIHQRFGEGVVIKVENGRLDIVFEHGVKTVIAEYVEKAPR